MPRHIYFIRHGETDWNQAQLFQGRTDVPLNVRGRAQAGRTAACIREHFRLAGHPLRFAGLVSSPLSRAVETATIVASALGGSACGLPDDPERIVLDGRLQEQDYGLWEGLSRAQIEARFPGEWERRFADVRRFQASGGESMDELRARVAACVAELGDGVLVAGHFGSAYALLLGYAELSQDIPRISQEALYIFEDHRVL
ncbi:MAG: histidine phosphatase family protein, partial [Desulfovibrio sp.]|nr:histidine phosphatase family protein [Desulfovibrio sp.]